MNKDGWTTPPLDERLPLLRITRGEREKEGKIILFLSPNPDDPFQDVKVALLYEVDESELRDVLDKNKAIEVRHVKGGA